MEQPDTRAEVLARGWLEAGEAALDLAVVEGLSGLGDRSTGTDGCRVAAEALEAFFHGLNAGEVGRLAYRMPIMSKPRKSAAFVRSPPPSSSA